MCAREMVVTLLVPKILVAYTKNIKSVGEAASKLYGSRSGRAKLCGSGSFSVACIDLNTKNVHFDFDGVDACLLGEADF
jgi:hypothetical protein